jgi:hypothetical protein
VGVTGFAIGAALFNATARAADAPMQPMVPGEAATPAPAPTQTAVVPKGPATNAPPAPPLDTFGQYGKIVAPSDQMGHPLRLKMPFPGIGEVKIPNADELKTREKLEELATLSDDEIRAQLEKWPAYSKMNLRDQGAMLGRIQDFRDYRANIAKGKAHDMGLLTLTPEQQAKFEKEYWDKRLQMDSALAKQFEPVFRAKDQQMRDELFREYSALPAGPIAQVPKPPVNAPPPAPTVTPPALTNAASGMPLAGAPPR